jgi:hypothetical protein
MLVSSCAFVAGNSASKDIEDAVEAYLDDMQEGAFTDDEYESDYADDTPFVDLTFADEASQAIMDAGFEQMSYDITDSSGTEKSEEGTCDVTITAVDVESILKDLEDSGMDAATLLEAITDSDAPTEEYEITLDMTYDKDSKEWLVSDSDPLVEILGDPYTEIIFEPEGLSATDVAYFYWYDYDINSEVSSYSSATTTMMELNVDFYSTWPGVTLYVQWYNNNGSSDYGSFEYTLTDEENSFYTHYNAEPGETISADTYRVVITLEDNSVLIDQSVTVY